MLSVILPSRQEPHLARTVADVLGQATGRVEAIVVLDGWWPSPELPDDRRVKTLHWGTPQGLRPSINAGMALAQGDVLMKLDAHCALSRGYDQTLTAACQDHEIVVPAKHSLEPTTWTPFRDPWHYSYLSWPWTRGSHGGESKAYDPSYNHAREATRIDETMTFQGSAWMMRRSHWDRLKPMDHAHYYYAQEAEELGLRTWLGGGRVLIVKDAWYAHLWKGRSNPRTFTRERQRWNEAMIWCARYWMTNQWEARTHDYVWLIRKFWPLPGWPDDWDVEIQRRFA